MTQVAERTNLIGQLTGELISKNVKPYQRRSIQSELPRETPIPLFVEELDTEDYEKTIVFENPEKGQSINIKRLASMYDFEGTKDDLVEVGDALVLPYGKGEIVHDQMRTKGCPSQITVKDMGKKTYVGVSQNFIDKANNGDTMRKIYGDMGMDPSAELLPLIVPKRKNANTEDQENWRLVQLTLIIPSFAE